MIVKRPADTRKLIERSWIKSLRTFSNNDYYDPRYVNFSSLQVINDDTVQPGNHTPRHLHQNMEIFGYVVDGPCKHVDNLGNVLEIPSGAVQRMSNGTGIYHTEGNASDNPIRYLQLWIDTDTPNTQPNYAWHQFTREDKLNQFCDITAHLPINSNAKLLTGIFTELFHYSLDPKRRYYVYVVSGTGILNGIDFVEGDGFAVTNESNFSIKITDESEVILFDLP